jgi:hypothetical protein
MFDTDFILKSLKRARPPGTDPSLIETKDYLPVPGEYVVFITDGGEILIGRLSFHADHETGAMFPQWEGRKPGAQGQRGFRHEDVVLWLG